MMESKKYNKKEEESEDEEDNITNEEISRHATESVINVHFMENLTKYISTDDLIRQETIEYKEKMATLKEYKQELEEYLIKSLDKINQDVIFLNDGSCKLTKYESVRKGGLKKDVIKQSISEQMLKEKLVSDDKKAQELAEITYNLMESKRIVTTKTCLKRTNKKEKKNK